MTPRDFEKLMLSVCRPLIETYGFRLEQSISCLHQPEVFVGLVKKQICIAPSISAGGPVEILIMPLAADSIHILWGGVKHLSLLERLRCPQLRLSPRQREVYLEEHVEAVIRHDVEVLIDFFPDLLEGRSDLLAIDSLDEVKCRMATGSN